ncbi:UDP-glucose 4-epimerase GalE [Actinoplanes sp. LDG1-06]|uniref:UDP-glucose 4-epimerase n=1 Tax=Paractinoplanes ovalisporus TaxID=2810368 RepID=A0ABS2ATG1_9ACTN|nr:UDP-glucose 4-epimerase GalE [Actinoplanes ovalisporus]MBM2623109.1 UDP-glucose 4-epimerase GalE [Actinoplanes ovalisporus]
MTWIVTGGAGYIGAHVVRRMRVSGLDAVVFDDLSGGRADRLPGDVELVRGSITEPDDVNRLLRGRRVDGVIHLAALKSVAESVAEPGRYQSVNVDGMKHLLYAMREAGVSRMVFSSSAAVYGRPAGGTVSERSRANPINPYGRTKLDGERLIKEYGIRSVVLRQFNVIGAGTHPHAADTGTTNLLPAVFRAMAPGAEPVAVLGDRYDTPTGTGVRDYVHVADVVRIYLDAIDHLRSGAGEDQLIVNVGTGAGHSVRDVLNAVGEAADRPVPFRIAPPRDGDVPAIVARTARAAQRLHWKAELSFAEAVRSAWEAWPVSG